MPRRLEDMRRGAAQSQGEQRASRASAGGTSSLTPHLPLAIDAWQVPRFGEPRDVLERRPLTIDELANGEILVAVEAIGLNFLDVSVCRGEYSSDPKPPVVPGAEVAGTVLAVEEGVTSVRPGDRVCGLRPSALGGFASATVLPEGAVFRVSDEVPVEHAAGLVVSYHTAYVSLIRRAGLQAGEWVLIHAGAGGTGSAAIQIAVAHGARVIATSRSEERAAVCRSLGAEVAIDTTRESFVDAVMRATAGRGANVILDPVGGEAFQGSLECIAFEGRLLPVGWASGILPHVDLVDLLRRNITLIGVAWGMAYPPQAPAVVKETHETILAGYRDGSLRPLVTKIWDFSEIPLAVQSLADGKVVGKAVIMMERAAQA
jgi:NADPH:quinone reductase